jgi:sugar phosphate isomerase/epimerase
MTKLSFTTMGTPEQDARGAIEFARQFGYQGVDLRIHHVKGEIQVDASDADLKEIRSILDSEGIELAGLLSYNAVGSENPASWQKMTDSLVRHLEIGVALNSPAIRMFGGNPYGEIATEEFIKRTAESINAAFEQVDAPINIVQQNHMGSYTAGDAMRMCDAVASNRFGLAFSPDHCILMKEDMDDIFARIRPYARQLYVSDVTFNPAPESKHDHSGILPGKGAVPIKDAYDAIGGTDFTGYVTFKWEKIWQPHLEEPEEALPYFINWWKAGCKQQEPALVC